MAKRYLLKSLLTGEYYKGFTNNLNRRINEHNAGKCTFTKKAKPWKLVYVQICDNRLESRSWEIFFKSGIGREVIKEIDKLI